MISRPHFLLSPASLQMFCPRQLFLTQLKIFIQSLLRVFNDGAQDPTADWFLSLRPTARAAAAAADSLCKGEEVMTGGGGVM